MATQLAQTWSPFVARKPLPKEIIPFILANLDGFDAYMYGERIIIEPRAGAVIRNPPEGVALPPAPKAILRPKFFYRVVDRALTPELAKRMGFSEQRLLVYTVVYTTKDPRGVQSKEVMDQTGLPHGTVQQILHWLRKQKLVSGEPEV